MGMKNMLRMNVDMLTPRQDVLASLIMGQITGLEYISVLQS